MPLFVDSHWAFRPRYDSVVFDTSTTFPLASVTTSIKQHSLGVEIIYNSKPPRGFVKSFNPYVGLGIGLVQTWYERKVDGVLAGPELPRPITESALAPGASLVAGCQVHPAMALELRVQTTQHHLEGSTLKDRTFAAAFHIWPAALFRRL
jgi:hypothetical protein